MAERILFVDIWHNQLVLLRTRPSELVPLMGLLYGHPGAKGRWERYLADLDAWQERRRNLNSDLQARVEALEADDGGDDG